MLIWLCESPPAGTSGGDGGGGAGGGVENFPAPGPDIGEHGEVLLELHYDIGDNHVSEDEAEEGGGDGEGAPLAQPMPPLFDPAPPLSLACYKGIAFKFRTFGVSI